MTRRSSGATGSRRSSRPRMESTSFRCARARTPGNGSCIYRLHVGNFPRATAVLPAGGKPGETVQVRWIGDPTGEVTTTIKLPDNVRARVRHSAPGRQGDFALPQRVPADGAGQRARERAERRPGARDAVSGPDGA